MLLREQIGLNPSNLPVVLNLAAIGITNGTWRNSPLEDWHGEGRIHDGGMLRTNVATTKLVREVLTDHLGEIIDDEGGPLIATDELFVAIFERLADPVRVLPDGRTLRHLAGEDLDGLVDHMDRALGGIAASAERHGLDFALLRAAAHGGLACSHWWGTPWWPDIVTEFLARLEDPYHLHWGKDRNRYARLPAEPAEVADRRQLRRLLLDAPEALSDKGADFCVAAGIGFIHEPVRAWKAAGTDERA
jgi:hypothetical protein